MSDLDLHYLATESTKEDRDKVKDENLLNAHRENIETILSALDKELQVLSIKAQQITDRYWEFATHLHSEQSPEENFSYFTVRSRLDEERNSLNISWQKRYPIKGRGTSGRRTNSKPISKGDGFIYPKKSFGLIRDWEYVAVEAAEQHFEKVRRQVEAIGKLRRSVRALGRLNEKSYDLKGNDDA